MSVYGTTKHSSCNQCILTLGNKVILYCNSGQVRVVCGTVHVPFVSWY